VPRVRQRAQWGRGGRRRWFAWLLGLGLALAIVQALAAGTISFPKSEEELKAWVSSSLQRHGPEGGIALGALVVGVMLLSQAQNIESAKRLLGLDRKQPDPPPASREINNPTVQVSGSGNTTLTNVRAKGDVVVSQVIHHHPESDHDPKILASRLNNLPPARPGFVARVAELDQLFNDLASEAAQVVIHGMPGVGKTTLALNYAHSARASYSAGMWWLDASEGFEPMALRAVTELEARIPGLRVVEGLALEARLRRCFHDWPGEEQEPVLLLVDNLPPPGEGVAMVRRLTTGLPSRFRCLFTQQASTEGTGTLKLPVLASADALELLKMRSGESGRQRIAREEGEALALVEEVGRLPLALVLLGGRLQRVSILSVSDLRKDLAQSALHAKAFSENHASFLDEQGVMATLLSSWNTLAPEAQELARLLSLTLPAPIPWELIERSVPSGPPATPQPVNRYWEDALGELVGSNLLDAQDADRPLYALHPLVRQFFSLQRRGWRPEPHWRRELGAAAQALAEGWQGENLLRAVEFWRQACEADPADARAAYGLGHGLMPLGDSEGARQAFDQSRRNAEATNDPRWKSWAFSGIGDVLVSQGDSAGAMAAYQAWLTIAEGLAKQDPANTLWQHDLVLSNAKIGDVLFSQGDRSGSLAAYQAGLTIAKGLVKGDPVNTQWQRDLFISQSKVADFLMAQAHDYGTAALQAYREMLAVNECLAKLEPANTVMQRDLWVSNNKIGDVLVSQEDESGALTAYQAGLTIAEDLVKRDSANTEWQRDLSISHERIGHVRMTQGDRPGALESYQASLTIRKDLVKRDPANTQWQRDLSVSNNNIGAVLVEQKDGPGALAAFQAGLAIREHLVNRDPANTEWQRDLSVSNDNIGAVLDAQGDGPGALAAFQAGLTIREGLAKRDPANTQWQRDLSVSQKKIGDVLMSQGDGPGALAAYQAGLAIAEGLAKRDPANTEWQRDLSESNDNIGAVLDAQGDGPGALAAFQAGLTIREGLAKRDPANTQWQSDLSVSHNKMGDVLVSQGDGPGALAAFQVALTIREGLAKRDPANTEWQRDLFISQSKVADVLMAEGDGPAALKAYLAVLATNEDLAKRDPANTQWQVDVAVSCSKLGTMNQLLPVSTRRVYLQRGREILIALKQARRLYSNQDYTDWFDEQIQRLDRAR
jgi:predicted negative regulator of RcsB-dependent stress response